MSLYVRVIIMFFLPVVFAVYYWGVYKVINMYMIPHPPAAFFTASVLVIFQGAFVYAAGEAGFLEDDEKDGPRS